VCFLDKHPVTNGHAVVVPKGHIQYFAEIDSLELFSFLQRAHSEICREYSPDATNIGLNDGEKAG
jgi:Diadenosine tetraphosphate (Ap4A) hydrolase and other HIT family hydrolases